MKVIAEIIIILLLAALLAIAIFYGVKLSTRKSRTKKKPRGRG